MFASSVRLGRRWRVSFATHGATLGPERFELDAFLAEQEIRRLGVCSLCTLTLAATDCAQGRVVIPTSVATRQADHRNPDRATARSARGAWARLGLRPPCTRPGGWRRVVCRICRTSAGSLGRPLSDAAEYSRTGRIMCGQCYALCSSRWSKKASVEKAPYQDEFLCGLKVGSGSFAPPDSIAIYPGYSLQGTKEGVQFLFRGLR
jgi:hypothetical protein